MNRTAFRWQKDGGGMWSGVFPCSTNLHGGANARVQQLLDHRHHLTVVLVDRRVLGREGERAQNKRSTNSELSELCAAKRTENWPVYDHWLVGSTSIVSETVECI
jgi:hypothetical protein